jgi:hypothetical protein
VPPEEISSSYSYQLCLWYIISDDGSRVCLFSAPQIMDELNITPPFFYSYQCGSTVLTSYIPVHMYSISLQVMSTIVSLVIIFSSSNMVQYPRWLLALFPGVCWPAHWQTVEGSARDLEEKPIRLIKPHQIISRTMNNIIMLLSFGLCSPVLCCYITVSISVHLFSWLMLVGRFLSSRLDGLHASSSGLLVSLSSRLILIICLP